MNKPNPKDIITILDNSGAFYIGVFIDENEDSMKIFNPAQISYDISSETGELKLNIFPVCFPEYLSENAREQGTTWVYYKKNLRFHSYSDVELDSRILDHYTKIFSRNI